MHQLPETKNRTFEEIAALFRPIQMDPSAANFQDYGCRLASFNLPQPAASGSSPNTPGGGDLSVTVGFKQQPDRFNFYPAGQPPPMGNLAQDQPHNGPLCQDHQNSSQGNHLLNSYEHQLPQHSGNLCTTIQNLSTSDQQPLIIDTQNDHCHHHTCQQQPHPPQLSQGALMNSNNSLRNSNNIAGCCYKATTTTATTTTSFMAKSNNKPNQSQSANIWPPG